MTDHVEPRRLTFHGSTPGMEITVDVFELADGPVVYVQTRPSTWGPLVATRAVRPRRRAAANSVTAPA
jgi:hypothetical protein